MGFDDLTAEEKAEIAGKRPEEIFSLAKKEGRDGAKDLRH